MDEARMWEQSANWKRARKFAALCEQHWREHLAPLEAAARLRHNKPDRVEIKKPTAAINKANYIAEWQKIMADFNWEGTTKGIAARLGCFRQSVHRSMLLLVKSGEVVAEGRRPILWKWIGDRTL